MAGRAAGLRPYLASVTSAKDSADRVQRKGYLDIGGQRAEFAVLIFAIWVGGNRR